MEETPKERALVLEAAILSCATGALHLYFAFAFAGLEYGLRVAFLLIGAVFFAGALLALIRFRVDLLLKAGLIWVALMILTWAGGAAAGRPANLEPLSFADKVVEAALLAQLVMLVRLRRRSKAGEPH